MTEEDEDGRLKVSGVRFTRAGREHIAKADVYVAALDVPGAKRLIPEVGLFIVQSAPQSCQCQSA